MLLLEPVIQDRLRELSALAGWDVRGATVDMDRTKVPAVDVRMEGASSKPQTGGSIQMLPVWTVTLAHRRGGDAAASLDAAITQVLEALHGWRMPDKTWPEFQATQIVPVDFADAGLIGYQLSFTTAKTFKHKP